MVTVALCRAFFEIFNVEKYCDLEIPVKSQSMSWEVLPFDRLSMVSYQCSIVTLSLVFEISELYSTSRCYTIQ